MISRPENTCWAITSIRRALPQVAASAAQPDSAVGDFAGAFAAAPVQLDVTYTTPLQSHAMMEPHATLADVGRRQAHPLHREPDAESGAGFRRQDFENAARKCPACEPLYRRWLRSQAVGQCRRHSGGDRSAPAQSPGENGADQAAGISRHDTPLGHRSNASAWARIATAGSLRSATMCSRATYPSEQTYEGAAIQTRTLYAGANRLTRHRLAPLDIPVASSMRAPGEAVGMLALECAMDELAEKLNLDPIELRVRNEPTEDPERHVPYSSRHLIACLQEGARRFGWDKRNPTPGQVRDGRWLVGMGMAAATRGNPLLPSKANVRLEPDGFATVRMAMTDIGTGTYTILTQIAAEMLGLPPQRIRMELGDTSFPQAAGSGGSFGAGSSGSALFDACNSLRTKLARIAGMDPETAHFANGRIESAGQSRILTDLVGAGIDADGEIDPGRTLKDYSQQSYGAHFAEVGVDVDTGEIRLETHARRLHRRPYSE